MHTKICIGKCINVSKKKILSVGGGSTLLVRLVTGDRRCMHEFENNNKIMKYLNFFF